MIKLKFLERVHNFYTIHVLLFLLLSIGFEMKYVFYLGLVWQPYDFTFL